MSKESPAAESKKRINEEKQAFDDLRKNLIERLDALINHDIWADILKKEILAYDDMQRIKNILKVILNYLKNQFNTIASKWILDILANRISIFEGFFNTLKDSIEVNKKDESIKYINMFEDRKTFKEYADIYLLTNAIYIESLVDFLLTLYENLKNQAQQVALMANNELVKKFESATNDLIAEVEDFRRNRNIADNAKTEGIYNNAVKKYRNLEKSYRKRFYWSIGVTLIISIVVLFCKSFFTKEILTNVEFWVLKLSIIAVGITLISYFLKQSSHYQRLADQNYQTQVELQAYPTFMESIPTNEAASVRKELALKYFGREIDGKAHKDMSNLISDQMKSTTEMVKAVATVVKKG